MHSKAIFIEIDDYLYDQVRSVELDSKTRFLNVFLLSNGQGIDLTGMRVILSAVKPDGEEIFNTCQIKDAMSGNIEVEVTQQMNAIPGKVRCNISVYGDNQELLTTKPFIIKVSRRVEIVKTTSSSEFKALQDLISDIQGNKNKIDNHLLIPHITYREVTPITTIDVLVSDNNEAILTDDDQAILPTGITRDTDNTRDTVISGVKIPDLPTVTPNDDDLVLLESKNGTASTKVSQLLNKLDMKYTEI